MKKYKLKKDSFFYKTGTICRLTSKGNLVVDDNIGTCVLHKKELKDHPELLDEWFEKIEEKKYSGRVPKGGDRYWHFADNGLMAISTWFGWICDIDRFKSGLAFWTYEEAEKEFKRRKAYVILKEDTKGFVPDWKNVKQPKYYVAYDYYRNTLDVDSVWCYKSNGWGLYFAIEEDARASIKNHRQQWVDYLSVEEKE